MHSALVGAFSCYALEKLKVPAKRLRLCETATTTTTDGKQSRVDKQSREINAPAHISVNHLPNTQPADYEGIIPRSTLLSASEGHFNCLESKTYLALFCYYIHLENTNPHIPRYPRIGPSPPLL